MKVRELIAELMALDQESEVILQKDGEGNGYSPLAGTDGSAIYIAESTWSGTVYDSSWTADDACLDEDEWQKMKDENPRCVVLFPVN
jgi:hypothetical protein